MAYTVGDVAKMTRVSVRTLHHYDEIDLVKPSARTEAGYRLYAPRDLERLQHVLFYRELGFALGEIARILADPAFDRRQALMAQRELLTTRAEQTRALVALIDKTIAALDRGETMNHEELFNGFDPSQYEDEARARWGGSPAFEESVRKARSYTKDDWTRMAAEGKAVSDAFVSAMEAGLPATDVRAMDAAEAYRQHISRWFYACSIGIHTQLGDMYVADPRFTATYEAIHDGLAQYVRDAIHANASRMS